MIPIINPFANNPCEIWKYREATIEEMTTYGFPVRTTVPDELICTISSPLEAANYMTNNQVSYEIERHIEHFLRNSCEFRTWRNYMPSRIPNIFTKYQRSYPLSEREYRLVNQEILRIKDFSLPIGQILFHGGAWLCNSEFMLLTRPLSTTFCPQVALREGEWRGKAYYAGALGLWVITIRSENIPAFVYRIRGTTMGNEKEVLLPSGICLAIKNRILITHKKAYAYTDGTHYKKTIPVYLYEIDATFQS